MTLAARIRRLSVAFHERTILHDITLDIPAEGITVLLGRSGSGKTTFLRALNRLNECLPGCRTSGEAELRLGGGLRPIYAGRTGEAALSDLRRRVGMVFQTPNILPASIRQNMLLPLEPPPLGVLPLSPDGLLPPPSEVEELAFFLASAKSTVPLPAFSALRVAA